MRAAFVEELCRFARTHDDVFLLTADLGYGVLDPFIEEFGDRFLNVGIAEQAMVGIAAGMALEGHRVVCYSIANFGTARCLEQFRNDVCHHDLPVILVTVGSGFAYGSQGYTHWGIEDAAWTSVLPNVSVATPADKLETKWATHELLERHRPAHLRLGRGGEADVHKTWGKGDHVFGKAVMGRSGDDVFFLTTGAITTEVIKAVSILEARGLRVGWATVPFLVPLDEPFIRQIARTAGFVVTVEEHTTHALGAAVTEVVGRLHGRRARVLTRGVFRSHEWAIGNQDYMRAANRLRAEHLSLDVVVALEQPR